jgi:hypothetical protein
MNVILPFHGHNNINREDIFQRYRELIINYILNAYSLLNAVTLAELTRLCKMKCKDDFDVKYFKALYKHYSQTVFRAEIQTRDLT